MSGAAGTAAVAVAGTGSDEWVFRGLGSPQVVVPKATTIEAMADEVLAAAPPQFVLVGHSLGGYVAILVAAAAPARVRGLVLVSTSARSDSEEGRAARREIIAQVEDDFDRVVRRVSRSALHTADGAPHPQFADLVAMMHRVGRATMLRQLHATLERPDLAVPASTLTVPTVVVSGRHDRVVPHQASVELAAMIPGARLVALDCGHMPPIERAAETRAALDLLLAH